MDQEWVAVHCGYQIQGCALVRDTAQAISDSRDVANAQPEVKMLGNPFLNPITKCKIIQLRKQQHRMSIKQKFHAEM